MSKRLLFVQLLRNIGVHIPAFLQLSNQSFDFCLLLVHFVSGTKLLDNKSNPVIECSNQHHENCFAIHTLELLKLVLNFFDLIMRQLEEPESNQKGSYKHRNSFLVVFQCLNLGVVEQQIPKHVPLQGHSLRSKNLLVSFVYVEVVAAV